MSDEKFSLIIPTFCLSGKEQMSIDLHFLNQIITKENIIFTLRFYLWSGNWISTGFHQKNLPNHWLNLSKNGVVKIIKRPSGGGAVLHSGGITYAITFHKPEYKKFSYQIVNEWLIESFNKLGFKLNNGEIKKSTISSNCFSSSFTSDLIDKNGFKRIGSAQYWKKGSFLQHGEIQLNPPEDLWFEIFKEESPPPINLNLNRSEIIDFLQKSFLKKYQFLNTQPIFLTKEDVVSQLRNNKNF